MSMDSAGVSVFRKFEGLRDLGHGRIWIICTRNRLFFNKSEMFFVQ